MPLLALILMVGLLAGRGTRASSATLTAGERPRGTPEERLRWLSTHEAGHAVAAWHCPVVDGIAEMVIEPTEGEDALWRGLVRHGWTKDSAERERLAWNVVISLAGLAAEMLCYGQVRSLLLRDVDDAAWAARAFCRGGTSWPLDAGAQDVALPFEVRCTRQEASVLASAWATACDLLRRHVDGHARVVSAIAARRRLGGRELTTLLGSRNHDGYVSDMTQ